MKEDTLDTIISILFWLVGATGIVFIVCKLVGSIGWSWWLVTAPFWVPIATWILLMAVGFIILGIGVFIGFNKR